MSEKKETEADRPCLLLEKSPPANIATEGATVRPCADARIIGCGCVETMKREEKHRDFWEKVGFVPFFIIVLVKVLLFFLFYYFINKRGTFERQWVFSYYCFGKSVEVLSFTYYYILVKWQKDI